MKYYALLNLKKEPFANSPDPDFLFLSRQHSDCLHQVRLAITQRRGLNVVVGPVGTGKTTLCRQIIKELSSNTIDGQGRPSAGRVRDDESPADRMEKVSRAPGMAQERPADGLTYRVHLFLESDFSSSLEFLKAVYQSLGFGPTDQMAEVSRAPGMAQERPADDDLSEWQLKEKIKHYLVDRGLEQDTVITLIFDEGQKLPRYCLEIIRELLNFETNNAKLIQFLIFGQEEFLETLKAMPDIADRVCNLVRLRALSFSETRSMIRYRLLQAGLADDGSQRELFGFWDTLLVHAITRGYPRKIIMLCSKILIGLIVRNRKKASLGLVFECADKLPFGREFRLAAGRTGALVAGTALITLFLYAAPIKTSLQSLATRLHVLESAWTWITPLQNRIVAFATGTAAGKDDTADQTSEITEAAEPRPVAYGYSAGAEIMDKGKDSESTPGQALPAGRSSAIPSARDTTSIRSPATLAMTAPTLLPGAGAGGEIPGRYPQTSTRLMQAADFEGLSLRELQIMRNEIYARHNYIFMSDETSRNFRGLPWYTPKEKDVTGLLTELEKANIMAIRRQEMTVSRREDGR